MKPIKRVTVLILVLVLISSLVPSVNAATFDNGAVNGDAVLLGYEIETTKAGVSYYHYETLVLSRNGKFELHIYDTSNSIMIYHYAKGTYSQNNGKISFSVSEGYQVSGLTSAGIAMVADWRPAKTAGTIKDNTIRISFMGYSEAVFK